MMYIHATMLEHLLYPLAQRIGLLSSFTKLLITAQRTECILHPP